MMMYFLPTLFLLPLLQLSGQVGYYCAAQRIAIIGGGITGTFVAKYLVDLENEGGDDNDKCSIQALTIFDPFLSSSGNEKELEINGGEDTEHQTEHHSRDRRLVSYPLENGSRVVELGDAFILSQKLFPLVTEMAKGGNLVLEKPMENSGNLPLSSSSSSVNNHHQSVIFHNGNGQIAFNLTVGPNSGSPSNLKSAFLWRYNIDLYVVWRMASKVQAKLEDAYHRLQDTHDDNFFYDSPVALWRDMGIQGLARTSLDVLLDKYMVQTEVPWWRKLFPFSQGSLRQEALSSILWNLCHQNSSQVNALAGLVAFLVATADDAFHIQGGNVKLISSAWNQAKQSHAIKCPGAPSDVMTQSPMALSTVVGNVAGFEFFNEHGRPIGQYDQVVIAVPMSSTKIEFLIQSHMDETAVLQQMPLGGLIENSEDDGSFIAPGHEGHSPLPKRLPQAVTRPYVQSVTTLVQKAKLQKEYWFTMDDPGHTTEDRWMPQQIFMTSKGKTTEFNVTGIFQINDRTDNGMYKVCSSESLSLQTLQKFFGSTVEIITENKWDIAPNYQGEGITTNFLLYDGATGFHGHTKAGALYYPSALEQVVSTIETQAMGAKAVAKLIAKRLDWLKTAVSFSAGDEL